MKKTEITCVTCGKKSHKRKAEIDRRTRLGKIKFYCNNRCAGKDPDKHRHLRQYCKDYDITQHSNNRSDEFSKFRIYYNHLVNTVAKRGSRSKVIDITLEYLKQIWEEQQGICPITGWNLVLRQHNNRKLTKHNTKTASLDRIDNTEGYIKGNIRFIAVIANYARNIFTDDDVIEFCQAVVSNQD